MPDTGRLCAQGNKLYEFWSSITALLEETDMSMAEIHKNQAYQDAAQQYTDHLHNCSLCWAGIERVFNFARREESVLWL